MAKKISELPAASQANDSDELEANQAGTSRKLTRAQIVAGLASASHSHTLADIVDAGALAGKDTVGSADIDDGAVTAAKIADGTITPVELDRTYSEPGHTHADATTSAAGFMSASDKSKLDGIEAGAQVNPAIASQAEAETGTDNAKTMTPLRTAQAIAQQAAPTTHTHALADITDAGALAAKDIVATADIADGAVTPEKFGPVEDTVTGAYAFAAADRDKVKVYTGAGDTWTIPDIGVGKVFVINDGTGAISLSPSGVTLRGTTSIPAEQVAALFWYAAGAKVHASILEGWIG
jgi:hypothetical protein